MKVSQMYILNKNYIFLQKKIKFIFNILIYLTSLGVKLYSFGVEKGKV